MLGQSWTVAHEYQKEKKKKKKMLGQSWTVANEYQKKKKKKKKKKFLDNRGPWPMSIK